MNAFTKLMLAILVGVALTACQTTAKTTQTNSKNRELVLSNCDLGQQQCNCLADQLEQNFTAKEWGIFTAMANDEPEPPEGTEMGDLFPMAQKIQDAEKVCGLKSE